MTELRKDRAASQVWRPPTRRAFVAMLGAAAAALALRDRAKPEAPKPAIWIGHC
jgi:hypothetical protein